MKTIFFAVVGLSMFAVGCGPFAGNASDKFKGTWSYSNEATTLSCPGGSKTSTSSGDETIVEGTDSDIVLTDSSGCNLKFNVNGDTATLEPGQTCSSSFTDSANGETVTMTVQPVTMTISLGGDHRSYTQMASGTVTVTEGGQSVVCSFTLSESATKVGK